MSQIVKRPNKHQLKRKSLGLILVVLAWSLAMGWLLAVAANVQGATPSTSDIGTVDVVPEKYQLGQQLYIQNCSTCHLAVPPAVLPTQTWKNLLEDSQHYGAQQYQPLLDPTRILVWRYLATFSRPLEKDEEIPYRVNDSRFFNALHPRVKLSRPVRLSSCVTCHPGANNYNFRRVIPGYDQ